MSPPFRWLRSSVSSSVVADTQIITSSPTQSKTSFRRLGRDTLVYGIGMMLNRAVSFLMLPIYTRYLSTADYGVLQLLDMTLDISYILFTAGMTAGLGIFYFQATRPGDRADIVRSAFVLEMSLTAVGSVALLLAAPMISEYGLRGEGSTLLVRITAVNFFLQMLCGVPTALLLLEQRSGAGIVIQFARLLVQVSLNILFVVGLGLGIKGILITGLIVNGIQGVAMASWMLRRVQGRVRMDIVRRFRTFGIPFQVSAVGGFLLSFGDRFFLQASRGASAVGLYGLAYQFGFLLHQLSTAQVLKAWNPQRLQLAREPLEIRNQRYARGFYFFNLVVITMATGIGVFVRPVIAVMTTPQFHSAADVVPIILAAYVVQSWGEVVHFGIGISERTKYYSYVTWVAVAVVMALYALLIPPLGGLGAALATLAAFAVRFWVGYYWSQRLWPVDYRWSKNLWLATFGAGAITAAYAIRIQGTTEQLAFGGFLFAMYALLAWFLVVEPSDRALVWGLARQPSRLSSIFRP